MLPNAHISSDGKKCHKQNETHVRTQPPHDFPMWMFAWYSYAERDFAFLYNALHMHAIPDSHRRLGSLVFGTKRAFHARDSGEQDTRRRRTSSRTVSRDRSWTLVLAKLVSTLSRIIMGPLFVRWYSPTAMSVGVEAETRAVSGCDVTGFTHMRDIWQDQVTTLWYDGIPILYDTATTWHVQWERRRLSHEK